MKINQDEIKHKIQGLGESAKGCSVCFADRQEPWVGSLIQSHVLVWTLIINKQKGKIKIKQRETFRL